VLCNARRVPAFHDNVFRSETVAKAELITVLLARCGYVANVSNDEWRAFYRDLTETLRNVTDPDAVADMRVWFILL